MPFVEAFEGRGVKPTKLEVDVPVQAGPALDHVVGIEPRACFRPAEASAVPRELGAGAVEGRSPSRPPSAGPNGGKEVNGTGRSVIDKSARARRSQQLLLGRPGAGPPPDGSVGLPRFDRLVIACARLPLTFSGLRRLHRSRLPFRASRSERMSFCLSVRGLGGLTAAPALNWCLRSRYMRIMASRSSRVWDLGSRSRRA